ncbi:MAG: FAD-dependent oxidoreductase [Alphaproteobacteria bacterium]|nr:FAD-dependent oxidoreductase [Alphaproteobacteria bacterium]
MLITPIPLPSDHAELLTAGSQPQRELPERPRVVILGGGFAGLACARALARTEAEVTVVDRHHSQTLQPLLPLLAAGRLPLGAASRPIAAVLGRQANARFVRGEVLAVDQVAETVHLDHGDLPYDFLVVATGARRAAQADAEAALALQTAGDGVAIRERVRRVLARAERTSDAAERRRLATFVIVGAGPTGVALAGAVAGLVRRALASTFPGLDPEEARIVLVEAAIRVLPGMPKGLSGIARRALQQQGVELRLGVPVSRCDAEGLVLAGKRLHWRFYADAAAALRAWGCRVGQPCHVIETFVGPVIGGHIWQDNVMIFSKSPRGPHTGRFLSEMVEGCEYVQNIGSAARMPA